MGEEHDGMDPGESSKEYREFQRMMDGAGQEGLRLMVERLTERIRANSHDTEALGARGLLYSLLGDHRRAAEDNGQHHRPGTRQRGGLLQQGRRLVRAG